MLHSPESSGEADGDPAAAGDSAEGSDLYQTEDGKHIALLLPVREHDQESAVTRAALGRCAWAPRPSSDKDVERYRCACRL